MTNKVKEQLLDYLTNDEYGVQYLINTYDWLGTGSDSKWADKQEKEAQDYLNDIVELVKKAQ